jgi:uncharacterized OsmC-like protein
VSDPYLRNSVRSYSSGKIGRSLNSVGNHHFIVDSPTIGEEITSGDVFLAGLSSCGVNLVEGAAKELGFPLTRTDVTIEGLRTREDPSFFAQVNLRFTFDGVSQQQAETLVERYKNR